MRTIRLWILILCLPLFFRGLAIPMQETPPGQGQSEPAQVFSPGERLVYDIKWDPPWYLFFLPNMEAGEVNLQLAGETEHNGRKAWKILFRAISSGVLLKMSGVKIDDTFTFFAEPETFCSLSVSKKIREGKRKRQIDVEYLRDEGRLHIREMDESVDPPKIKKDAILNDIPSCVHDPFSAIYVLRRSPLKPNSELNFVIGHDDKIKEIRAYVEKKETVQTPAGTFPAWRIKTVSLMGGLFKEGGQFKLWVSADQRKVPLQFEVKVNLGKVVGKLKSVRN